MWSSAGAVLGLFGANVYMRISGRQSIIVIALTLVLFISTIGVPIIGAINLKNKVDTIDGYNLLGFKSLCAK
jgi:hypothetical protein